MRKMILLLSLILACAIPIYSQSQPAKAPGRPLDSATRRQVIEGAIKELKDNYVFPEIAAKMEAMLRERLQRKEYDSITEAEAFASLLTHQPRPTAAPDIAPALPNTPSGKTLGEFITAFNTGDIEQMRRFHRDHGGDPGNADEDMGFYQQSGGLKLHSVTRSSDTEIEVLTQSKKEGRWLAFSIEVNPNPPHAIANIRVQPGAAPSAAPADRATSSSMPAEKSVSPPAKRKKLSETEMIHELESYLEKQSAEDRFSGALLVAKSGNPLFKRAYGLANKTTGQPNRVDTRFNLGSMNKMFTAVAIAQLAEKGRLSFNDTVGKHLPDYPNKAVADKVTIHHLLTHTSGLGSYWNKKFDERKESIRTVGDYLALFEDDPLRFEPGARFEYSNAGFIVLGAIIERVSGQNYYDYVRGHIYKPAGMTGSDCFEMNQQVGNLAMGYTTGDDERPGNGPRHDNTGTRPNRGGPAGGGYSTVEDLLRFHIALRDARLISKQSLELLTTAKTKTGPGGYGYGFMDMQANGSRWFGHNGGAPGIAAELRMFPETGYTIAVMSNYDPPALMQVVRKITDLVSGN